MANDIADLLLRIDATTEGLRREMKKADDTVSGFDKNVNKKLSSVDQRFSKMGQAVKRSAGLMAGALAAIGLTKLTSGMVSVNASAQTLMASLETVTGSLEGANKAWAMLEEFASTTPFQLEQSVNAFVKMKALGLDPTEGALTSFGNTAAAMGKDLNQMIEAVADASTSEFERLKEFGIKARKQGDEVSFVFQGVTTTIGNNAEEIVDYLESIGNTQFAGAMERQMGTLNGSFSNLGDTTDKLIRQIGQSGVNEGLSGAINWLTGQMDNLSDAIEGPTISSVTEQIAEIESALEGEFSGRNAGNKRAYLNRQLEDLRGELNAFKAYDGNVEAINTRLADLNDELAGLEGSSAIGHAGRSNNRRIAALKSEIEDLQGTLEFSQPVEDFVVHLANVENQTVKTGEKVDVLSEVMADIGVDFSQSTETMGDSWVSFLENTTIDELIDEMAALGNESTVVAEKTEESTERLTTAWDLALQDTAARIDESFANAWRGAFDSFDSFADSLLDSFKNLLAEMAHLAITRPIIMQLGASMGLGSVSTGASAAGAAGGIFGGLGTASSLGSMLGGGITGLAGGLYNKVGMGATYLADIGVPGMRSVAGDAFYAGGNVSLGGMAANAGAGVVGGYAGTQVGQNLFNRQAESAWGATAGGALGSIWGPWGSGIGSALGGLVDSVFGSSNSDKTAEYTVDFGTGRSAYTGLTGDKRKQGNEDIVLGLVEQFRALSEAVGGSTSTLEVAFGSRDGLRLDGVDFGSDEAAFFSEGLRQLIEGSNILDGSLKDLVLSFNGTAEQTIQFASAVATLDEQIKSNPVTVAIEQMATAQEAASTTLWDAYQLQLGAVQTLATNFDGSAASAVEMSDALRISQDMAYQMSIALINVSDQINKMFQNSADQIRESVMTEDQRVAKWKSERDTLQAGLQSISDPEALLDAAAEINALNLQIFESMEDASAETAEIFASYADETSRIAQERIESILSNLEASQESQILNIGDVLQGAADRQSQAADVISQAAAVFSSSASDFNVNWSAMSNSMQQVAAGMESVARSSTRQANVLEDVSRGGNTLVVENG